MEKETRITITNEYTTEDDLFDECGIQVRSKTKRSISTIKIDNPTEGELREIMGLRSDIQVRIVPKDKK
jgi:hypothetical protein